METGKGGFQRGIGWRIYSEFIREFCGKIHQPISAEALRKQHLAACVTALPLADKITATVEIEPTQNKAPCQVLQHLTGLARPIDSTNRPA